MDMIDVVTKEEWAGRCCNAEERLAEAHARVADLERKLNLAASALDEASEYSSGLKSYADNLRAALVT
jgi:hypothetical protein